MSRKPAIPYKKYGDTGWYCLFQAFSLMVYFHRFYLGRVPQAESLQAYSLNLTQADAWETLWQA